MKVVIPMAGRGSRYADRGWNIPKPLIEVAGRPMVQWALESLSDLDCSQVIFILLQEHEDQYNVQAQLETSTPYPTAFVFLDSITEGQLCTVLKASHLIDTQEDVLVMASDTLVIGPQLANDIENTKAKNWAGLISVADLPGDRWSFARLDEEGKVVEVAEKVRISDHASTGLYYFSRGKELVEKGSAMIERGEKTRGEYYVIPVYQKFIDTGKNIGISKAVAVWDMGTPEAKLAFEENLDQIRTQLHF